MRTVCGTILVAAVTVTCAVGMADGGNSVPERGTTSAWRPSVRWRGFNLLGMFCQTKMEAGDKRIFGYFPEDHFQWMEEWGFNFARLPLDYRFFADKDAKIRLEFDVTGSGTWIPLYNVEVKAGKSRSIDLGGIRRDSRRRDEQALCRCAANR